MRPAVSVGRATALDVDQPFSNNVPTAGHHTLPQHDFGTFLDYPEPLDSDRQFLGEGFQPHTNNFDLEYDHLVSHDNGVLNDFDINDYLHHDDISQPAPEVQPSDSLAEKTSLLQPPFGASLDGCDVGGNAVSV